MATKNLFGWASQSETKGKNGKKGDQTGAEVKVGNYYNFGQTEVIRFPNVSLGRKAGEICKFLCKCDMIGYGQDDRTTLFNQCAKFKWDFGTIQRAIKDGKFVECNTDCSGLVSTVINITYGKKIVNCFTTSTMKSTICKCSEKFKILSVKQAEKQFYKGDIVYKIGHCIMNV